jgi:uncharacterized protein
VNELILIGLISFITSFVSGMLGLGGAVILIPAYLYLPELFGISGIGIKEISGITSVQVFFVSLTGLFFHHRKGVVDKKLITTMGIPIVVFSMTGAFISGVVADNMIIGIFGIMAIIGAFFMIKGRNIDDEHLDLKYNRLGAAAIAGGVGFFGGMVGAPGAFILAPLMIGLLKIPVRVVIGSTLGIVLLSAFAASIGKIASGQVPFELTAAAVAASLPGVVLGSKVSHLLKTKTLRYILAILISIVGIEMWYKIIW